MSNFNLPILHLTHLASNSCWRIFISSTIIFHMIFLSTPGGWRRRRRRRWRRGGWRWRWGRRRGKWRSWEGWGFCKQGLRPGTLIAVETCHAVVATFGFLFPFFVFFITDFASSCDSQLSEACCICNKNSLLNWFSVWAKNLHLRLCSSWFLLNISSVAGVQWLYTWGLGGLKKVGAFWPFKNQ